MTMLLYEEDKKKQQPHMSRFLPIYSTHACETGDIKQEWAELFTWTQKLILFHLLLNNPCYYSACGVI